MLKQEIQFFNKKDSQKHNTEEKEDSMEVPTKFEALIVLGKNWKESPPKEKLDNWQPKLSLESKINVLAAGEMFKSGLVEKLIFSGGKTAGKTYPSEAESMATYLKEKFPEIPNEAVIMENESIDTHDNAEKILKIIDKESLKKIALLTVGFHLPRSEKIFETHNISIQECFKSEELLKKRSPHYKKFVENFLKSKKTKIEELKEALLRGLLYVDANGRIPRILIEKIRK